METVHRTVEEVATDRPSTAFREAVPGTTRSTARDGLLNRVESYATSSFPGLWAAVERVPPLRRQVNRALINRSISRMPARPNPLSTMAPYTSWDSLTDRTWDSRHLPPAPDRGLPPTERVADLFTRRGAPLLSPKSTVLLPFFAQWFTDGFLRTDRSVPPDQRRNESNHEIDTMQLYGLTPRVTEQLRTFEGGTLKSRTVDGHELPPLLCEDGEIKPEFSAVVVTRFEQLSREQRDGLLAMGSDTSNLQVGFGMFNTLFLREHNRVARLLHRSHPRFDDERLFATARMIVTAILIKLVVEEYINHLSPLHFRLRADPAPFRNEPWNRPNRMAVEFNLLYRWHSLVPSVFRTDGRDVPIEETLFNNEPLLRRGLGPLFEDASRQPAGRIGLRNTPPFLWETEALSIRLGRAVELASYNDYRVLCGFPRVTHVHQISSDPEIRQGLLDVYGHVDRIELYVGLFAEDVAPNSALPPLLGTMVSADAFSQALTNPLLAPRVFNANTFTPLGMSIIAASRTFSDVLHRNLPEAPRRYEVSMTRSDWQRV